MLDFYKISDDIPKPDWPEKINLERVDGLAFDEFEDLKKKGLIEERFHYWMDFRWNYQSARKLHDLILEKYPQLREHELKIKSVNKLFNIIDSTVRDNSGLIAYCD
ncbi:MAG: hypothetical protein HEP71_27210 [Roseivirga sp.]|nr:hypothetical protein [Roseivirga sp.]